MSAEMNIKNHMESIGMKQVVLSILTGISTTKINLILSGKRRLSLNEFSTICYVLDLTPNDLLTPTAPSFLQAN